MQQYVLDLIHPSRYQVELRQYLQHGTNADVALALKKFKDIEGAIEKETGISKPSVREAASALDASYDYVQRIISIPRLRGDFESVQNIHLTSGIDYAWQWAHEHGHHEQSDRNNPNVNFKMAQISRALYYRPPNYPKWFRRLFQPKMDARYASNYNELLAHTASAKCLTQAYAELRRRHDFTVEDRDILLPSYEQRVHELTEYLSRTSALTIAEFNNAQLRHYSPDEIVCLEMTCADVQQFLRQHGSKLYLQAIADLQHATRDLARVVKEMKIEVGERRSETQEYQKELALQYQYKQKAKPPSVSQPTQTITEESPDDNTHDSQSIEPESDERDEL